MTRTGYFVRLAISIVVDALDFTFGGIPVLGTLEDGAGTIVSVMLWGWSGLFYSVEVVDDFVGGPVSAFFANIFDGYLPTATIIAIGVGLRNGHLLGKYKTPPAPKPPLPDAPVDQ